MFATTESTPAVNVTAALVPAAAPHAVHAPGSLALSLPIGCRA
jgi:hypothetical protein